MITKSIAFDYRRFQSGEYKELFVAGYREVEILRTDCIGNFPIAAFLHSHKGVEFAEYNKYGRCRGEASRLSLGMIIQVKEPHQQLFFIVSYPIVEKCPKEITNYRVTRTLYSTYQEAMEIKLRWSKGKNESEYRIHNIFLTV